MSQPKVLKASEIPGATLYKSRTGMNGRVWNVHVYGIYVGSIHQTMDWALYRGGNYVAGYGWRIYAGVSRTAKGSTGNFHVGKLHRSWRTAQNGFVERYLKIQRQMVRENKKAQKAQGVDFGKAIGVAIKAELDNITLA